MKAKILLLLISISFISQKHFSQTNWNRIYIGNSGYFLADMHVLDSSNIYGIYRHINDSYGLVSTDAGQSWNTINFGVSFNNPMKIYFSDPNTGFVVGVPNGTVLKTTDGGSNWSNISPSTTSNIRLI